MSIRSTVVATLVGTLAAAGVAHPDVLPERSPRTVDYDLSVALDPDAKEISGSGRIVWRNRSGDAVPDLWFHLYLNAFRNSDSTFFRESGGRLRRDRARLDDWGWIDVTALRLADGTDLLPTMTFEQPDDGNPDDLTVARVVLPEAVPAGGEVNLEIEFEARLPEVFARTGWAKGDFFLVGQWFPKLGVYEPAGMRGRTAGGWNCHQFHAHSEFYADYGGYRVEIDVPSRFVVGATGVRTGERDLGNGRTAYVYQQQDVHDFAWTADSSFLEYVEKFSGSEDVTADEYAEAARRLDRPLEELRLGDVEIRLLLQPEHRSQAERYLSAARLSLKELGLAYGRYPYPTLTVVDPPRTGRGAGGMEYPTLVTGFGRYPIALWPLTRVRLTELVTTHEIAHQYFYGLVGSNEFEESWLDEGFTSWAEGQVMVAGFGDSALGAIPGLRLGPVEFERAFNHLGRRFDAMRTAAWRFSAHQYRFYSYGKPTLLLATLERLLGQPTMARVMRTWAERWRFRHPSSDDFYAVAEEVSGVDLGAFFAQLVESAGVFDPAVVEIESRRVLSPRGRIRRDGEWTTVSEREARSVDETAAAAASARWRSTVELRHLGAVRLPVEVELRFAGRDPERRAWDGTDPWARWELETEARLLEVVIDPDRIWALDASRLNNHLSTVEDGRPALWTTARLLFWVQRALAEIGL